jgi:hypothetical protein
MSDEKKVTTTTKDLGEAKQDKIIGQKKLTTQHIKDSLDQQSAAGKTKPEPAPDSKKEGE